MLGSIVNLTPVSLYSIDVMVEVVGTEPAVIPGIVFVVDSRIGILSPILILACLLFTTRSLGLAKTLANPKLRVVNNKQAKINIGDKLPILLSTTNTIPGITAGSVPTTSTITSIEYKDTGVKFTIEPSIHLNNDVTIKLQLEVTRLGDLQPLGNGQSQF